MVMKKWQAWEEDIIRANWNIPMRELLVYLPGRTRKTIYWKAGVLGFTRQTFKRYVESDDIFIKENYRTKGNFELGRILKRTGKSISKRMIILGLKRTDDDLKFLSKTNRGCFKVGKKSEREVPNGNLRLNLDDKSKKSFYDIKINKKFIRLSRYLYENYHNVKLKKTDVVFHADGDSMNVLKENLVLITRADLLNKNIMNDDAFIKRIFRINDLELIEKLKIENPELIDLKRNTLLLNQKINKKENAKNN